AAIVSLAAKNDNAAIGEISKLLLEESDDARASILHQLQAGDAKALGGQPICFAHLSCGEDLHAPFALDSVLCPRGLANYLRSRPRTAREISHLARSAEQSLRVPAAAGAAAVATRCLRGARCPALFVWPGDLPTKAS